MPRIASCCRRRRGPAKATEYRGPVTPPDAPGRATGEGTDYVPAGNTRRAPLVRDRGKLERPCHGRKGEEYVQKVKPACEERGQKMRTCEIAGCELEHYARGFCSSALLSRASRPREGVPHRAASGNVASAAAPGRTGPSAICGAHRRAFLLHGNPLARVRAPDWTAREDCAGARPAGCWPERPSAAGRAGRPVFVAWPECSSLPCSTLVVTGRKASPPARTWS